MHIPFHRPAVLGNEIEMLRSVITNQKFCGDGEFTKQCHGWLEKHFKGSKALLTTSCTHALEIAALLIDLEPGDEVIMPSYTFVSTANPFVLHGAVPVFVDIDPKTMNLDLDQVEAAITSKTKAIVPVHYAGTSCDMEQLCNLAKHRGLVVIEDAAQALMSNFNDKPLGGWGEIGCISFHETKNIHCGEGGAIIINAEAFKERAEYIREKGTNRNRFLRGMVDKYTWVDIGSSYLPSELNAGFLMAQLENAQAITNHRIKIWNRYKENLENFVETGLISERVTQNGHMFFIKAPNLELRTNLIANLKEKGIQTAFHYIPLHSSPYGKKVTRAFGELKHTNVESERILRLPLFHNMTLDQVDLVSEAIRAEKW